MLYFKKGIGVALFVLLLLLILTGSASASDIQITYVYYETSDEEIVKVDFAKAVRMAQDEWPRDRNLYDAAVKGIGEALLNERDVVIVVKKDGTDYILDYAAMIEADEPSITDGIEGNTYRLAEVPDHDLELLIDQTGKAEPKPADLPGWLLEEIKTSWVPLAQRYLVIIEVDFSEIESVNNWAGIYGNDDNRLKLRGVYVSETGRTRSADLGSYNITLPDDLTSGTLRLLVRDPGISIVEQTEERDELVIRKQDIEIITKVDTTTYTYTWEGVTEKED